MSLGKSLCMISIMDNKFILEEMSETQKYCHCILAARKKFDFESLRYPITDVFLNRYFTQDFRKLIAEHCNITGYLTIPAVQFLEDPEDLDDSYGHFKENDREVCISLVRSEWQDKMAHERKEQRQLAIERKAKDEARIN